MNLRLDEDLTRLLASVRECASGSPVYLVGGAVRDLLLGRPVKDLDFVLAEGSIQLAKSVSRRLNGSIYVLDDVRHSARVILRQGKQNQLILDFTSFIGQNLEEDLRQRDFTINAIAIDLDQMEKLIDPLNGQADLSAGQLRLCGPESLTNDPLRVLRGVRLISSYGLKYSSEILTAMRVAIKKLGLVSGERIRGELFKCLGIEGFDETARLMMDFGVLDQFRLLAFGVDPVEPMLSEPPLLAFMRALKCVLAGIRANDQPDELLSQIIADQAQLDAYRRMLQVSLQGGRTRERLLILCALMLQIHPVFDSPANNLSDLVPALFAEQLTQVFLLGQKETTYLRAVSGSFIRLARLSKSKPEKLDYYRFFREFSSFGLDGALLAMIDLVTNRSKSVFNIDVLRQVFNTWFTQQTEVVDPPRLVDGNLLIRELGIQPGAKLGYLLEAIREQQVIGLVRTADDAFAFGRREIAKLEFE